MSNSDSDNILHRKSVYKDMYNECPRSTKFTTVDIDRALKYYSTCPEQLKEHARLLAISEVFSQLKLVLSRVERNEGLQDDLLNGNISPSLSRTLLESTKQVNKLKSYLEILEKDICILELVLEVI